MLGNVEHLTPDLSDPSPGAQAWDQQLPLRQRMENVRMTYCSRFHDFSPCSVIAGTCATISTVWAVAHEYPSYVVAIPALGLLCTCAVAIQARQLAKVAAIKRSAERLLKTTEKVQGRHISELRETTAILGEETSKRKEQDDLFEEEVSQYLTDKEEEHQHQIDVVTDQLQHLIPALDGIKISNEQTIESNGEVSKALGILSQDLTYQTSQFKEEVQKPLDEDIRRVEKDLTLLRAEEARLNQQEAHLREDALRMQGALNQLTKHNQDQRARLEEQRQQLDEQQETCKKLNDSLNRLEELLDKDKGE